MSYTPIKTPKLLHKALPGLVWSVPTKEQCLYLTFDDGPTPEVTSWVLDLLKHYNAKATFFCVGKHVVAHPALYERIVTEGHTVGNHTYDHIKGWNTSAKDYTLNVEKAAKHILSKLFRPPYGQITPKQVKALKNLGYHIVMWNVLSVDWNKAISPEQCATNVIENTMAGDIIVFHDSLKAKQNMQSALPQVLDHFSGRGFKFESLSL